MEVVYLCIKRRVEGDTKAFTMMLDELQARVLDADAKWDRRKAVVEELEQAVRKTIGILLQSGRCYGDRGATWRKTSGQGNAKIHCVQICARRLTSSKPRCGKQKGCRHPLQRLSGHKHGLTGPVATVGGRVRRSSIDASTS